MLEQNGVRVPFSVLALQMAGSLMLLGGIAGANGALDPFTTIFQDRIVGYVFAGLGVVLAALSIPGMIRARRAGKSGQP